MSSVEQTQIDQLLQGAVDSGGVAGVAAIVVGPEGIRSESYAGSTRADGSGSPIGADTMFRNASMTKSQGSVGLLQLVEQGKVSLDQPVADIIPAFGELKVLEGFDGDEPILREPKSQATLTNLLTHTAGHGYFFGSPDLVKWHETSGIPTVLEGQKSSLNAPLVFDPGTIWNYGINTDWVGQVVETVSGQDLQTYLTEHLWGPLGMKDTTFAPSSEQRDRMMTIHHRLPDGGLLAGDMELPLEPEFWASGHGSHATARDYSRFLVAMLKDGELEGERILKAETVDLAFSDHLNGIPIPEMMVSVDHNLALDVPSLPFKQGWGLGFHLTLEDVPGMRKAGTGDWAGIFNSFYWIDRSSGVAAVIYTQLLPFFDPKVVEMLMGFELAVYAG